MWSQKIQDEYKLSNREIKNVKKKCDLVGGFSDSVVLHN